MNQDKQHKNKDFYISFEAVARGFGILSESIEKAYERRVRGDYTSYSGWKVKEEKGVKSVAYSSLTSEQQQRLCDYFGEDIQGYMQECNEVHGLKQDQKTRTFLLDNNLPVGYAKVQAILEWIMETGWKQRETGRRMRVVIDMMLKGEFDDLPNFKVTNMRYMQMKVKRYRDEGFRGLLSSKIGNQNPTKMNEATETVLKILASQRYSCKEDVVRNYNGFLQGKVRVVHPGTSELLMPDGCSALGQRTITDFVRTHSLYTDAMRLNPLAYRTEYTPFNHRNAPVYSLSKLTMDDKQIALTLNDGRVMWVYLIFDVRSKALIAYSCSASKKKKSTIRATAGRNDEDGKTTDLFVLSLANLFENLALWGINKVPHEIETERHIAIHEKSRLEALFPFVRFCAAVNPQEKHAEGYIRNIRYGAEKAVLQKGYKARPFARDLGMKLNGEIKRDTYSEAEAKELIRMIVERYNLEGDKMQVFRDNLHPEAQEINQNIVARYTKKGIETTLRRNSWFQAGGKDWHLKTVQSAFAAEGDKIQAYILAGKAYIYQNDNYLGEAFELNAETKVQTAQVERTERDEENQSFFSKYKAEFEKVIKAEKEKLQGWEVEELGVSSIVQQESAKPKNKKVEEEDFIDYMMKKNKKTA